MLQAIHFFGILAELRVDAFGPFAGITKGTSGALAFADFGFLPTTGFSDNLFLFTLPTLSFT